MAPIFTGRAFGFGRSAEPSGPAGGTFATLVTTDTFTEPFTSNTRLYTDLEFILVGAGGMAGPGGDDGGGQGGFSIGRFVVPTSTTLYYSVGKKGFQGTPGPGAGGIGWNPTTLVGGSGYSSYAPAGYYGGGGGGGATGVFVSTVDQTGALVIAGGGGGSRYSGGIGGNGGGLTADTAPSPGTGTGGGGGSQIGGGSAGLNQPGSPPATAIPGTALNGGDGSSVPAPIGPSWAYGGGGGGAGYYGGGGGGGSNSTSGANSAGGGGGSGYLNQTSPYYRPYSAIERVYVGMGLPAGYGTGPNPAPLGAGYLHPAISPYYPGGGFSPNSYGAPSLPSPLYGNRGNGVLIVRYYA